jgi:hypothetical protein
VAHQPIAPRADALGQHLPHVGDARRGGVGEHRVARFGDDHRAAQLRIGGGRAIGAGEQHQPAELHRRAPHPVAGRQRQEARRQLIDPARQPLRLAVDQARADPPAAGAHVVQERPEPQPELVADPVVQRVQSRQHRAFGVFRAPNRRRLALVGRIRQGFVRARRRHVLRRDDLGRRLRPAAPPAQPFADPNGRVTGLKCDHCLGA